MTAAGQLGLHEVLPAVLASLGVSPGQTPRLTLPPVRGAVVVLIDGLGHDLLVQRSGHAPWLRSQRQRTSRISSTLPSTTATSMASFGTGLLPGAHGLLGYEVLDPATDRLLNELSWEDGPVPEEWQPSETLFERAARGGLDTVRIGPGFFDGSGLTRAALRGGRFVAADSLAARVDAALAALRAEPHALVYLYWGDLDKVGHVHGPDSFEWGAELEALDTELSRLHAGLPRGISLTITSDHGMVYCPQESRVDLAHVPELTSGVRHVGGEPRARQLYCTQGASADVHAAWTAYLGDRAEVRHRAEVIEEGRFGEVHQRNLARLGDVLVTLRADHAVVDSRRERPELLALKGLHGSSTAAEVGIPLVHVPA
jgi:hypothetical protein